MNGPLVSCTRLLFFRKMSHLQVYLVSHLFSTIEYILTGMPISLFPKLCAPCPFLNFLNEMQPAPHLSWAVPWIEKICEYFIFTFLVQNVSFFQQHTFNSFAQILTLFWLIFLRSTFLNFSTLFIIFLFETLPNISHNPACPFSANLVFNLNASLTKWKSNLFT